jgi:predicted DNA-binding transcriptional regulator AlpA
MTTRPPTKVEKLNLEELAAQLSRVMSELLQGKITPKEARAIDRAFSRKLTLAQVAERYGGVNVRTIDRWTHDPKKDFPQPLRIGRRPLWDEAELEAWERDRARPGKKAKQGALP